MLNNGLTASDLGLVECGQYCNPERPTTIVPGGKVDGKEYAAGNSCAFHMNRKRTWFVKKKYRNCLGDWIKPEQGELIRHALYTFDLSSPTSGRNKRVLLAGDAAHLMPPFMGQGMCAGLRDVWNLSWKLDRVLKGEASDRLLDSYENRTKASRDRSHKIVHVLGSIICIPDKEEASKRPAFSFEDAPQMAPFPLDQRRPYCKRCTG